MTKELVNIESYEFVQQAEAAKELLENHGIHAFLMNSDIISMDWALGNAVGYVKLQVSTAEAEAALAILRERQETRARRRSVRDDAESTACLACGADIPASRRDCPSCGWSYQAGAGMPAEAGEAVEDEPDWDDRPSALDAFRNTKRSVF
jgi:hypothetical protein